MHPHHAAMEQMAIMRGAGSQPLMNTMCRLVVVVEESQPSMNTMCRLVVVEESQPSMNTMCAG
jgi:hypothetical protein